MDRTFRQGTAEGSISIPGSKSQTIRAMLLATFASGVSTIFHALDSKDTESCLQLCRTLGASMEWDDTHTLLTCDATEVGKNLPEGTVIDCGNSGTTLYLSLGLLASLEKRIVLTGDGQLKRRPIEPLLQAYEQLGVSMERMNGAYPPFSVKGPIAGGSCIIACPTSQYLSSLLLGCCRAEGDCHIDVSLLHEKPYVDMTIDWLDKQHIRYDISEDRRKATIRGRQNLRPFACTIPGDFSSASFFFCMAAICHSTIAVEGLDPNDTQGDRQLLNILAEMGCSVVWKDRSVTVTGPDHLAGGTFDLNAIPDTLPILAVTSCFAEGEVSLVNVPQARIKETDRIAVMHEELAKLGATIEEREDGMTIKRGKPLHGGTVSGHGDHRIIMALATAALGIENPVTIEGVDAVDITFPTFFSLYGKLTGEPS